MKKSNVWLMAILGMATVLTGCSKDNDNGIDTPTPEEGKVEIMAKSKALTLSVDTKAPFDGTTIDNDHILGARVFVSKTTNTYTTLHTDGTMAFGTNNATNVSFSSVTSGNKFFPGNDDIFLVGLYPITTTSIVDGAIAYTIDGKSDVMYAPQATTNKIAATAESPTYPQLAFTHLLTKLNIKVKGSNADAAAAWGEITNMSFTKANDNAINTVITVPLASGTATFATSENQTAIPCFKYVSSTYTDTPVTSLESGSGLSITKDETQVAYALVPPITLNGTAAKAKAYELSLKTSTSGNTALLVPITITSTVDNITSTKGYAFDITLTFSGTEIKATATVTDWVAGGTGTGTIQ